MFTTTTTYTGKGKRGIFFGPPMGETYQKKAELKFYYEKDNHLGSVLVTVSDQKIGVDVGSDGTVDYYNADVLSAQDYYSFGSPMPGRGFNSPDYKYGFNGQEKIDEIYGNGNYLDFAYRGYNPRLGRFFAIDPLSAKFPFYSPYQFASNSPILAKDLEGLQTSKNVNETETGATSASANPAAYSVTATDAPSSGPASGGAPVNQTINKVFTAAANATTAKVTVGPQIGVDVNVAGRRPFAFETGKSKDLFGINQGSFINIGNIADPNAPVTTSSTIGFAGFGIQAKDVTTTGAVQPQSLTFLGATIQVQNQTTVKEKTLTASYLVFSGGASMTTITTKNVMTGIGTSVTQKSGVADISNNPNPVNNTKFGVSGKLLIGIELEFDFTKFKQGLQ